MSEKCFFAYPSEPKSLSEVIEDSIKNINFGNVVHISSWKEIAKSGTFIINEICDNIDRCQMFACDLTYLNPNVLFELGYAIARDKKIWITLDPSINNAKINYSRLRLLTTVGYTAYSNSPTLRVKFYKEAPYKQEDEEKTIFKLSIRALMSEPQKLNLFYLKSSHDTQASICLTKLIGRSSIDFTSDDPNEVISQTLSWYVQQTYQSVGVIAHLLSTEHSNYELHNSKHAFICGLAYGFNKPLLMLAHSPYPCPIDYNDLLRVHETANQCEHYASEWLTGLERNIEKRKQELNIYRKTVSAVKSFQSISIGEFVAENEIDNLDDYFVVTGEYLEALDAKQVIYVGKKGSGKTANLYKIAQAIEKDKRNTVCIIKPESYDMFGIQQLFNKALTKSEKGYLIESIWKYLIYSELANTVYNQLIEKPISALSSADLDYVKKIDDRTHLILTDFASRLDNVINCLLDVKEGDSVSEFRINISEKLHDDIVQFLRYELGNILKDKNKVFILVDNLDKVWDLNSDLKCLSEFFFGLIDVSKQISQEFSKKDHWRQRVNLSLIVFIRSDIFYHISRYIPERDKITYTLLRWDNVSLLQQIIEKRFHYALETIGSPEEMWRQYFCSNIKGISTKDYITQVIIPRPRDIIFLCRSAISDAINRQHNKVQEEDILSAEKRYSQYALESLIAENPFLEELLYELIGHESIITNEKMKDIINKMNPKTVAGTPNIVELLIDLSFLCLEIEDNIFEFVIDQNASKIIHSKAMKHSDESDNTRYLINRPFHAYLEIKSNDMKKGISLNQWIYAS